jgi:hypothetical protein
MSEGDCERFRILLEEGLNAISAHFGAISPLAETVSLGETVGSLDRLKESVRASGAL